MARSRPLKDETSKPLKSLMETSDQVTLVIGESSPSHQYLRILRQNSIQTVYLGLDTVTERQVCWHLLQLSGFPPDVRLQVLRQLTKLRTISSHCAQGVLGLWEVPNKGQVVLVTPYTCTRTADAYLEQNDYMTHSVRSWLLSLLALVEECRETALKPLRFTLENVRVTGVGELIVEDLIQLPDSKDERYIREFLAPAPSCEIAALGHFVLSLTGALPSDSPCMGCLTDFSMACFRHLHEESIVSLLRSRIETSSTGTTLPISLTVDLDGLLQVVKFEFRAGEDSPETVALEFLREFQIRESLLPTVTLAIEQKATAAGWVKKKQLNQEIDLITLSPVRKVSDEVENRAVRSLGNAVQKSTTAKIDQVKKDLLTETRIRGFIEVQEPGKEEDAEEGDDPLDALCEIED